MGPMKKLHHLGLRKLAYRAFHKAISDGSLERPCRCSVCGKTGRAIHGHHTDYSKPLDVIWCCEFCHGGIHGYGLEEHKRALASQRAARRALEKHARLELQRILSSLQSLREDQLQAICKIL